MQIIANHYKSLQIFVLCREHLIRAFRFNTHIGSGAEFFLGCSSRAAAARDRKSTSRSSAGAIQSILVTIVVCILYFVLSRLLDKLNSQYQTNIQVQSDATRYSSSKKSLLKLRQGRDDAMSGLSSSCAIHIQSIYLRWIDH